MVKLFCNNVLVFILVHLLFVKLRLLIVDLFLHSPNVQVKEETLIFFHSQKNPVIHYVKNFLQVQVHEIHLEVNQISVVFSFKLLDCNSF